MEDNGIFKQKILNKKIILHKRKMVHLENLNLKLNLKIFY